MKLKIKEGTTNKPIRIFVQDSAATDGSGKTGIAYNASGLTAAYIAEGDATTTQITLASGTTGTYSSGGWSEVDSTLMPGVYEVGLPDACVDATSEGSVLVMFKGATDMVPVPCEIELDKVDYRDDTNFGLTRLDDAISTRATVDGILDELLSGHNVAGSLGKILRQIFEGVVSKDGQVDDTGATATTFITNLTETTDGFYHDKVIVFTSGDLSGQARHIETYTGSTKSITVSQAFTSAPADADEFLILATHEHSLEEIAEQITPNHPVSEQEQTVEAGNLATVIVNVVDRSGQHVSAIINTSTTRLQKGNSSDTTWDSVTPTVDTIATGVYRINFSSLSPELTLTDNDDHVRCKINGTIGGVAWTEYHVPIRVVPSTPRSIVKGIIETSGVTAPTTTEFTTEFTVDEPYEGRTLIFTSGVNEHLATKITSTTTDSSNIRFTVQMHDGSAMPSSPSDGDTFEVI